MKYLQIVIDGYNFLKTTGMLDVQVSDSELEKGRRRLIGLLVKAFPNVADRQKLTVVFDSATLLDLPRELTIQGIEVRFAKGYDSADELIMEIIRSVAVPKRLLVVSSDHEIQVSAQRRRAKFIDSDQWLDELEQQIARAARASHPGPDEAPDPAPTALGDTEYWKQVFAEVDLGTEPGPDATENDAAEDDLLEGLDDIFPPGYGEDLLN